MRGFTKFVTVLVAVFAIAITTSTAKAQESFADPSKADVWAGPSAGGFHLSTGSTPIGLDGPEDGFVKKDNERLLLRITKLEQENKRLKEDNKVLRADNDELRENLMKHQIFIFGNGVEKGLVDILENIETLKPKPRKIKLKAPSAKTTSQTHKIPEGKCIMDLRTASGHKGRDGVPEVYDVAFCEMVRRQWVIKSWRLRQKRIEERVRVLKEFQANLYPI